MSKSIELVKPENLESAQFSKANVSAWVEIDGWEETTHKVSIMWRVEDGENRFTLNLIPKTLHDPASTEMSFDEIQSVRHEQHTYPFVAPHAGHLATINALGISEAA